MSESKERSLAQPPESLVSAHIELAEHESQIDRTNSITSQKEKITNDRIDYEVAEYAGQARIEIDEKTNKRLKRMIDRRILPVMIITYFMQALDKGAISFVSIMNLPEDTHLVGQQFNWLTTCIYIAILVVEYPTNLIIQRVPIGKYLSFNIICWGITLACHAACKNFTQLLVVRTLLGIFEACCQPTFVILR
ncbi:unnamed protein product [Penicillium glandicola]